MRVHWSEILGWYGVIVLLGAYALVSFEVLAADSIVYQALNITGSLGIMAESLKKKDGPAMVLNAAWALIGLVVLAKVLL